MARLHEHQGKALLAERGLAVPRGHVATTPEQAREAAADIAARVVLKIQAWTTGRAASGGVAFADTPDEAARIAKRLLAMKVGAFPVDEILIEEAIPIQDELFVSLTIDDAAR
ncbi:MAG: ATP-grasp domain-containing protein, partial [Planctomycetota bacterium]|nr:ATP-grasp domain-containing protein [Planctomycetota bacterium]